MTLSKAVTIATLTFGVSVGAFAQSATPYHYGMNMDIARVIALDAPGNAASYTSTATLTYRDSDGNLQEISYLRPTTNANQN